LQRHPPVPDKLDKTLKALALAILTTNELKKLDSNISDGCAAVCAIIHFDVPHRSAIDVAPGERRVVKIGLS